MAIKDKISEWQDTQKWILRLVIGWLVTTGPGALYLLIQNAK
jgi:hypothetical protein